MLCYFVTKQNPTVVLVSSMQHNERFDTAVNKPELLYLQTHERSSRQPKKSSIATCHFLHDGEYINSK